MDWVEPGTQKAVVCEDSSTAMTSKQKHYFSLLQAAVKSGKHFVMQGTAMTTKAMNSENLTPPGKLTEAASNPGKAEHNMLLDRLLELTTMFSSMEKWAALNYAMVKNQKIEYNIKNFDTEFPRNLDKLKSFLSDGSTRQAHNDILTLSELVAYMTTSEKTKAKKETNGMFASATISNCAIDPGGNFGSTTGEQPELDKFEGIMFADQKMEALTQEEMEKRLESLKENK
jgi:hypothetical protein